MTDTTENTPKISRTDAQAQGLRFYFTGLPCANGHIGLRYTRGSRCLICTRLGTRRQIDREHAKDLLGYRAKVSASVARHYARHAEEILEKKRAFYIKNSTRIKAATRARNAAKKAASQTTVTGNTTT